MLCFFGELGFQFPQFPFIAHSRGWSRRGHGEQRGYVKAAATCMTGREPLVARCTALAERLLAYEAAPERGARRAQGALPRGPRVIGAVAPLGCPEGTDPDRPDARALRARGLRGGPAGSADRRLAGRPGARSAPGRARLRVVAGPGERGAGPARRGDQPFTARLRARASAAGVTRPRVTSSAPTNMASDRSASPTPARAASWSSAPHEAAGGAIPLREPGLEVDGPDLEPPLGAVGLGIEPPTSWPSWKIGSE